METIKEATNDTADQRISVASPFMDKHECAKFFDVTVRCLENWMAGGKIPYSKPSKGIVRFNRDQVIAHFRKMAEGTVR